MNNVDRVTSVNGIVSEHTFESSGNVTVKVIPMGSRTVMDYFYAD